MPYIRVTIDMPNSPTVYDTISRLTREAVSHGGRMYIDGPGDDLDVAAAIPDAPVVDDITSRSRRRSNTSGETPAAS